MKDLSVYIRHHWQNTIRQPKLHESWFTYQVPYTTPCADEGFTQFFYWDTYFTNLGLLTDGQFNIAKDNLLTMAAFIMRLGYVPNADHLIFRSQPPLFARGVADYLEATKDIDSLSIFLPALEREHGFFLHDRATPCGLAQYSSHEPIDGLIRAYDYIEERVGYTEEERHLDHVLFARDLLAIAESGWDFNLRYPGKHNRFDALSYVNVDLNSILYDEESKIAYFYDLMNQPEDAKRYREYAAKRKALMERYMQSKSDSIFYDYNFVEQKRSPTLTLASFYPYALGVSQNKAAAKQIYEMLRLPYGVSVAKKHEGKCFQWDYPNMWPPTIYFLEEGFSLLGEADLAKEVRNLYCRTVEKVFQETGHLWEKYDALEGKVSVNPEYKTPTMMGWTAGVYEYFQAKDQK